MHIRKIIFFLTSVLFGTVFCRAATCCGLNENPQDSISRQLKEVVVLGNDPRSDNLRLPQMGAVALKGADITRMPVLLGEPDVLKALQTQAGVSSGIEGFSGIYVRGGENDENLYLLNGLPLYNVNHLGGLFSSFNVAVVDNVKFYKSGFPVEYGGMVASVSDIQMRRSDFGEYHGHVSVGLLSGNAFITGPIVTDRLAFSASVRRSWFELASVPVLAIMNKSKKRQGEKIIGQYAFTDINLKLDYVLSDQLNGYTHFYAGRDRMKAGSENFSTNGDFYEESNTIYMKWGNWGAASCLNYSPTASLLLSANVYYSHYSSTYQQDADELFGNGTDAKHNYSNKTSKNGIADIGASLRATLSMSPGAVFDAGAAYISHKYMPEELTIDGGNGFGMQSTGRRETTADEFAVWENNTVTPVWWLHINAGARMVSYRSEGKSHLCIEPRANMRVSLTETFSLKASYARANQFVQQMCNSYVSLPTEPWLPVGNTWKPLRSDIASAGIYGDISDELYFSAEGYYKWFDNILEYREDNVMFTAFTDWSDKLTTGSGKAYGMDLTLHKDKGRLTGSLSYGLMWNRRKFAEFENGQWFPAKYDNRHKININFQYRLKKNVELNMAWTYMTGNRMTLALSNQNSVGSSGFPSEMAPTGSYNEVWGVDRYTSRNNVRLPAYHRLDLGINFRHPLSGGRESVLAVGLYNAYSRMNPIVISKKGVLGVNGENIKWNTRFRTLGLLPVIPSISYTYKF